MLYSLLAAPVFDLQKNKECCEKVKYVVHTTERKNVKHIIKTMTTDKILSSQGEIQILPDQYCKHFLNVQLAANFRQNISQGPFYICLVCNQIFYKTSVSSNKELSPPTSIH